jgi:hypothetical protein
MSTTEASVNVSIAVDIPNGYIALPLDDIDDSIAQTESLFVRIGPGTASSAAPAVLQALRVMLTRLAQLNVVYCGLGKHLSSDGGPISSTIIISLNEYGERRNPRLTLGEVLSGRRAAGETFKNAELVEISGRPLLLLDRIRTLPAPELLKQDSFDSEQAVYQLEAVAPSPDGSTIAVIEFSTASIEYGDEFLPMIAAMAASIEFTTTPWRSGAASSLDL